MRVTSDHVSVEGASIAHDVDGAVGGPAVMLVHGFAAHRHWWDAVLPQLTAASLRVARIDLSGHGGSAHRATYSVDQWAREVDAVSGVAFGDEPFVVVGHSFGGRVACALAGLPASRVSRAMIIDTSFRPPHEHRTSEVWRRPHRVYPTRDAAVDRFRLIPPQPIDEAILRSVASHSVCARGDGWSWRHDPNLAPDAVGARPFTGLRVPLDFVYGERSVVVDSESVAAFLHYPSTTVTAIPGAHHHVVLDSPRAVAGRIIWATTTASAG